MAFPRSSSQTGQSAETGRHSAIARLEGGEGASLSLHGRLTFPEANHIWKEVRQGAESARPGERFDFDMSNVETVDGGTMALLVHLRGTLAARGVVTDFVGAPEDVQALIHLYRGDVLPVRRQKRRHEGMLAQVGRATSEVFL